MKIARTIKTWSRKPALGMRELRSAPKKTDQPQNYQDDNENCIENRILLL